MPRESAARFQNTNIAMVAQRWPAHYCMTVIGFYIRRKVPISDLNLTHENWNASGRSPLSPWQAEIWLAMQLLDTRSAFNLATRIRVFGTVDIERLRRAIAVVYNENEQLRTIVSADVPEQFVTSAPPNAWPLSCADADETLNDMLGQAFGLEMPLQSFSIQDCQQTDIELIFVVHHLVFDGRSQQLLFDALVHSYLGGDSHADSSAYLRYASGPHDSMEDGAGPNWDVALAELRMNRYSHAEGFGDLRWTRFILRRRAYDVLKQKRQQLGCTFAELLFVLFSSSANATDMDFPIIRMGVDSRPPEFRNTIGNFTNTLPVRIPVRKSLEARIDEARHTFDWLKRAKATSIGTMLAHADRRALSNMPMMTHRRFARVILADGCAFEANPSIPTLAAKAPLMLQSIDYGDEVALRFEFDSRVLDLAHRNQVIAGFEEELQAIGIQAEEIDKTDGLVR